MPPPAYQNYLNPSRVRSYILRIPLCTRVLLAVIVVFWVLSVSHGFQHWAQLAPEKIFAGEMHRLSTYPYLHLSLFHTFINVISLIPLLERFESENGTLVTAILFTGPFSTFPGILYAALSYALHIQTPIQGSSIWVFLLATATLARHSRTQPRTPIPRTRHSMPTVALPLLLVVATALLMPGSSLFGHACGAAVGYAWALSVWARKLLVPPEKLLRWVEEKGRLRVRLPSCYVSVERLTYGRYGVLPTAGGAGPNGVVSIGGERKLGV